ncbi:MAG TPA: phosphotransferase [Lacisediminihabitans sp.]|uniref:phosphotransferase n=1 Tax=Lacisediminihabitans sp. TaxID=2787631 RepID=UPI002ED97DBE
MDEETLAGGNSSTVVRVGNTVRRTAGPWTPAVHRLLTTLRLAGIAEVPEHLGLDDRGREILSFLPGRVANYPLPDWLWSDTILEEAGRLLRRVHDASVPLVAEPLDWSAPRHEPAEVVCHNDAAPYNLVFADGHVTGLIDFDTASPGPRLWDLAHLAYRLVPFVEDADPDAWTDDRRFDRLDRLVRAYGIPFSRAQVLSAIGARLEELATFTDRRAAETGRPEFLDHAAMYRRDRTRLLSHLT